MNRCDCPLPDVPADGKYAPKLSKFLPGDEVTYTCKKGFILTGGDTKKCKSSGAWSARTPFCDRSVKLKNPRVLNTSSDLRISHINDGNHSTCFMWKTCNGCDLQMYLDKKVIVHAIRILLDTGAVKIRILTGLDNNMTVCGDYDRFIEKKQWIVMECKSNGVPANALKITDTAGKSTITTCEIKVYVKDEDACESPPKISVANGHFEVSRAMAMLFCDEGYKRKNGRLICEEKSWKNFDPRCDEIFCDYDVYNSFLTLKGEWTFLDSVRKLSVGTRRQLKCNNGFQMINGPDIVTCQKNGSWTRTKATCIETKSKTSTRDIITGATGGAAVIIILILLGIIIYLIRKQKNREVVVVYKSPNNITAPETQSEYKIPYYESIHSSVPGTPRATVLLPALNDSYIRPEDYKEISVKENVDGDIEYGVRKQSNSMATEKNREVVIAYKSADDITTLETQSEYANPYYASVQSYAPATPRPTALPPDLSDGYSLQKTANEPQ